MNQVRDLKGTLATMLAAINCLVSLACYYKYVCLTVLLGSFLIEITVLVMILDVVWQ